LFKKEWPNISITTVKGKCKLSDVFGEIELKVFPAKLQFAGPY
jgi:hypothetical protein